MPMSASSRQQLLSMVKGTVAADIAAVDRLEITPHTDELVQ